MSARIAQSALNVLGILLLVGTICTSAAIALDGLVAHPPIAVARSGP